MRKAKGKKIRSISQNERKNPRINDVEKSWAAIKQKYLKKITRKKLHRKKLAAKKTEMQIEIKKKAQVKCRKIRKLKKKNQ